MRLASFSDSAGESFGIVEGDAIFDVGRRAGQDARTLDDALRIGGLTFFEPYRCLGADVSLSDVQLLTPIRRPGKIICVGRNYRGHVAEAGLALPEFPSLFVRVRESLVGHGAELVRPVASVEFDFEGELALVIGRPGRHVPPEAALEHVAGYACFNDGSVRDYQFGHSLTAGKNFHATGSFGPWLTTAEEIPDPSALELCTRLNGREVQRGELRDLIFDVPSLISYVSRIMPLAAGDVIATGTPEGVGFGRKPPLWMQPGDVLEVEVRGIGVLRNPVVAEVP